MCFDFDLIDDLKIQHFLIAGNSFAKYFLVAHASPR
jgi:hypothetical protein